MCSDLPIRMYICHSREIEWIWVVVLLGSVNWQLRVGQLWEGMLALVLLCAIKLQLLFNPVKGDYCSWRRAVLTGTGTVYRGERCESRLRFRLQ